MKVLGLNLAHPTIYKQKSTHSRCFFYVYQFAIGTRLLLFSLHQYTRSSDIYSTHNYLLFREPDPDYNLLLSSSYGKGSIKPGTYRVLPPVGPLTKTIFGDLSLAMDLYDQVVDPYLIRSRRTLCQ